jgi:hypothetical protein
LWVDIANGNFGLQEFSSAIDGAKESLMPEPPTFDLAMRGRFMHSSIDMGAFEAQKKGELVFEASSITDNKINRKAPIVLSYNKPVLVVDESGIQLTSNSTIVPIETEIDNGKLVIIPQGLEFNSDYNIVIPYGTVSFEGNATILNMALQFDFSTFECEPVTIQNLSNVIEVCPHTELKINVSTLGDLKAINWMFNYEELPMSGDTLIIADVTPQDFGIYTVVIDDYCSVGTSQELTIKSKDATELKIIDKWGTLFFIDNHTGQLSDYKWFFNNNNFSSNQFVDMRNTSGSLMAHAFDEKSGCVLRSEKINIRNGSKISMAVYPNPVVAGKSVSVVVPSGFEPSNIVLFDITGRLIVRERTHDIGDINFDKTNFTPGVYILQIEDEQGNVEYEKLTIY